MNNLANFITILSLFFGFASIAFSLESHFTVASWAIIISVVLDGLDGQIARLNKISSEFGKELDSLVDVVSFGVAPSILGYTFVCHDFYFWAVPTLFVYLLCSVMRLAKYNVTPKEKLVSYFYGLPTTASGGAIASFILIYRRYTRLPPPVIFLLIALILAMLMVSKVKYLNLFGLQQALGRKTPLLFLITLIVFIFIPEITIFALFLIYLISSPFVVKEIA